MKYEYKTIRINTLKGIKKTEKMKQDARSYKHAKETATDTSPGATDGEV